MQLGSIRCCESDIIIAQDGMFENLTFNLNNLLPDTLTYCGNEDFLKLSLERSEVSSVITTEDAYNNFLKRNGNIHKKGIALSKNPRNDFFKFHNFLYEKTDL